MSKFCFAFSMGSPPLYIIEFEYNVGGRVTDILRMKQDGNCCGINENKSDMK
jgi:hypothetical protein